MRRTPASAARSVRAGLHGNRPCRPLPAWSGSRRRPCGPGLPGAGTAGALRALVKVWPGMPVGGRAFDEARRDRAAGSASRSVGPVRWRPPGRPTSWSALRVRPPARGRPGGRAARESRATLLVVAGLQPTGECAPQGGEAAFPATVPTRMAQVPRRGPLRSLRRTASRRPARPRERRSRYRRTSRSSPFG